MKKRFGSVFLALALCVGLAVPAFAAGAKTTYHLNYSQITTAANSEVSITGEGLEQTGEIFCEYGLGAGQDEPPRDYYPVFTASKPVTVTVTADYTDWRHTGTERESGDDFDYISHASVASLSYNPATDEYTEIKEHAAYFDGTYAAVMYDGSIKENAGTLKEYYMGHGDAQEDAALICIYKGASVTLSEPGIYKISVMSNNLWSSRMNYAVIRIMAGDSPSQPAAPAFTDVPAWCSAAVDWAVGKNVTQGYGGGVFGAGDPCTHAQILTFLWRAAGEPLPKAAAPVIVEPYYQQAVNWAYGEGIIDGSFSGAAYCTRGNAVIYIWKAFGEMGADGADFFIDVPVEPETLFGAVYFALASGITNGYANGDGTYSFRPGQVCSRGEIITFLHRAYVPEVRLTLDF